MNRAFLLVSLPAMAIMAAAATGYGAACQDTTPASDVRGNYDVAYDNVITLRLGIGGATYEETVTDEGGMVMFDTAEAGPLILDLGSFCTRPEVQCPSETFWTAVSVDQPYNSGPNANSHIVNVVDNRDPMPPPGVTVGVAAGLIDETDRFVLALGAGAAGVGSNCGLLAISLAGGRFTHEGETGPGMFTAGAPVDGIAEGELGIAYFGACAFGGLVIAATLTITTGYTAVRTGELDPPPYTPIDPEDVPPGIDPEAGLPDGGTDVGDAGVGTDAGDAAPPGTDATCPGGGDSSC